MKNKNNKAKRKDKKGRVLRTGETQRKDGIYEFRYTDQERRHSIYADSLDVLRQKEKELQACQAMGEAQADMAKIVTFSEISPPLRKA